MMMNQDWTKKILNIMTWTLVLVNISPILWMVWCSLMGNNEILQGKLIPSGKSNDIVFVTPEPGDSVLVGTINGELYRLQHHGEGHIEEVQYENQNMVAADYLVLDSSLWVMSANKALVQFELNSLEERFALDWGDIEDSYLNSDQTSFVRKPEYYGVGDLINLSQQLNSRSITDDKRSFADISGVRFLPSIGILNSLNAVLDDDDRRGEVLEVLKNSRHWQVPIIHYLLDQDELTISQERILFRYFVAELFPHMLTRFEMINWVDIWTDRIPDNGNGISLVRMHDKISFGMWWSDFPGIGTYDPGTGEIDWLTMRHGLPESSIQHLIPLDKEKLIAVSDEGLSMVDIRHQVVEKNYLFGDYGLPYFDGRKLEVVAASPSDIIISFGQAAILFDLKQIRAFPLDMAFMEGVASDVSSMRVVDGKIYIGTSEGLIAILLEDWLKTARSDTLRVEVETVNDMFLVESQKQGESKVVLQNALIKSIVPVKNENGNSMFVAGIFGHLAKLNPKTGDALFSYNLPEGPTVLNWRNYEDLWRTIPFAKFLKNSLIICFSVMVIAMLVSSLSGYALARYRFPGKETFGYSVLATQMIPGILYLIPIFVFYTAFFDITGIRLVNTYAGLIFTYSAFFIPMSIWILRGFFATIPKELEEAALIDGCTHFGAFIRIIVPAALPGIIATGIYVFLLAWDELMFAWVLSTDIQTATIPVGIRLYVGQFGNRFDLLMAASTVATLPAMILFFLMQKQIVSGLTQGAVKE